MEFNLKLAITEHLDQIQYITSNNTTLKNSDDISFSYKKQIFHKFGGYILIRGKSSIVIKSSLWTMLEDIKNAPLGGEIINPWHDSPGEPRPIELVAAT